MSLFGEGEYNLNELKEIEVTKDFLELEQNVRACQYNEPIQNCTTRHEINQIELFFKILFICRTLYHG